MFNVGFGLFFFFLYKFLFFFFVQIKYGTESFSVIDGIVMGSTVLMLAFYSFCLVKKLDWFTTFTSKITGRRPKINIMDTLARDKVIDSEKIKRIEKRFIEYMESLPEDEKPEGIKSVEL